MHSLIELLACGIGHVVLFVVVCCWLRVIVICCLLCVVVYVLFVVHYSVHSLVDLIVFVEIGNCVVFVVHFMKVVSILRKYLSKKSKCVVMLRN